MSICFAYKRHKIALTIIYTALPVIFWSPQSRFVRLCLCYLVFVE